MGAKLPSYYHGVANEGGISRSARPTQPVDASSQNVVCIRSLHAGASGLAPLSIEFCGEWQLFAIHHRTQYLNAKV